MNPTHQIEGAPDWLLNLCGAKKIIQAAAVKDANGVVVNYLAVDINGKDITIDAKAVALCGMRVSSIF